jgi:hypothetical protein
VTYRDLEHQLLAIVGRRQGVKDRRELRGVELDCNMVSIERSGYLSELH